jgi:DNA polymerase III subunit epsilon
MSPRSIFFDLETTGLRPESDRIIEIAAYDAMREKSFQSFVNPQVSVSTEVLKFTNISQDDLDRAPVFSKIIDSFLEFCEGEVVLIAHNGKDFDVPFLMHEMKRCQKTMPQNWLFFDTLPWAREYRKDLPRHSLQYLRQIFQIPKNQAHRALDDSMTLYQVFSYLTDDLTLEEILKRSGAFSLQSEKKEVKRESGVLELF